MTREKNRNMLIVAVAVAALSVPALPAIAAEELAVVSAGGAGLEFAPKVQAAGWVLTVSGPSEVIEREFKGGEAPSFAFTDRHGKALPDGVYRWELRARPRPLDIQPEGYENARGNEDGSVFTRGRAPRMPIQAGTFSIYNGMIIDPNQEEPRGAAPAAAAPEEGDPMTRDFVINDDLIVDGSACIGFDCVNGEVFSFDTIRLKENNLRIRADDTSTVPSFPANDWVIRFNASANGGASEFAIDDDTAGRTVFRIEANAPSNSLVVDDGGRLGLGTGVPSVELHIIDGDTPTLRLQQDGSSGFTPQTWDVAGNETNFFIRDVTNGSSLPFRIRPDAASNALFIDVDDSIGFGTSAPDEDVHLRRTDASRTEFQIENTNGTAQNVGVRMTNSSGEWLWRHNSANALVINANGNTNATFTDTGGVTTNVAVNFAGVVQSNGIDLTSSRELKTGFESVNTGELLDRVAALEVTEWQFKDDPNGTRHIGPVAEDFKEAFGLAGDGTRISMTDANGVALAAIKGLAERNQALEAELAELKSLEGEVAELKALVRDLADKR